jgi:hypothetical protein
VAGLHLTVPLPPTVQALLLATASPASTTEGEAVLATALPGLTTADWVTLIEHALAHGTAALLCQRLLALDPALLPRDIAEACQAYLRACEAAASSAITELTAVLSLLAASGVPALPFKGVTLGAQAYGNPALRPSRDIDILIPAEHVEPALAALGELGYRSAVADLRPRRRRDYHRYNGQDILFAPGKLPIEPHWTFAPRTLSVDLDTPPIFARASTVRSAAWPHQVPCFAPEDALLVAALHGGKEQWARLLWIADVAALLSACPAICWTSVLGRAAEAGCLRMVLLAAALARDLLQASLSDYASRAVASDPSVGRLATRVREALFAADGGEAPSVFALSLFRWRMRERLADRLHYASRTLLAARVPHFRTIDLPDRLSFLYPAMRIGHDFVALPLWKAVRGRRRSSP